MKRPSSASRSPRAAERRLNSWKEIASHLRVSVRTVQRWEKSEGLPVERHLHRTHGTVSALASRVDQWLAGRQSASASGWRNGARVGSAQGADTRSVAAHEAFLKGAYNLSQYNYRRDRRSFEAADRFLRRALELDRAYADPLAEAAFLYFLRFEDTAERTWAVESELLARRALELDRRNLTAHFTLGFLLGYQQDSDSAMRYGRKAIEIDPASARAQSVYGSACWFKGFLPAAEAALRRATELDPLYLLPYNVHAHLLNALGRHDAARARALEALEIEPHSTIALDALAACSYLEHDWDGAESVLRGGLDAASPVQRPVFEIGLAFLRAARGERAEARRVIESYRKRSGAAGIFAHHLFLYLCAQAGESELAVAGLRRHPYLGNYPTLVRVPVLEPLVRRPTASFRTLVDDLYRRWQRDCAVYGAGLLAPEELAAVPSPAVFLAG